ncbi:lipopolysaccharide biosynthesis protein [Herbaspirillum seropedicae]|uniref:lipopolysaccharide biosynthesis protein n=1 Tax=Herbaspirillum seropedicae TaxID=964 RepID=UPI003D996CE0
MKLISLLGFFLRGGSAGAKFLFVLYLAGKTSSSLLGQVAVLMTIAAAFTQVAGLEINQVIGRQLHALTERERLRLLRRQAQAAMLVYLVLAPTLVFAYADMFADHWLSFSGILLLEHFLIEVYRFNILVLRPVYASSLLFIKNVGWVLLFMVLVELNVATPSLSLVLYCWFGVLALTALPLLITPHAWPTLNELLAPSNWLPQSGALVWQARTFILSAVAAAGISSVDKLLIAGKFPSSDLGIYFFFFTCASLISLVASFSIGATIGPQCIKIYTTEGRKAYLPHLRHLKKLYWTASIATMAVIILPADFLLTFFGKTDYHRHTEILYLLAPSAALVVLCEPYKMDAYLERQDWVLLGGNFFHLVSVTVCIALFSLKADIDWIAAGVLLSSLLTYAYFALNLGNRVFCRLRQCALSANESSDVRK